MDGLKAALTLRPENWAERFDGIPAPYHDTVLVMVAEDDATMRKARCVLLLPSPFSRRQAAVGWHSVQAAARVAALGFLYPAAVEGGAAALLALPDDHKFALELQLPSLSRDAVATLMNPTDSVGLPMHP